MTGSVVTFSADIQAYRERIFCQSLWLCVLQGNDSTAITIPFCADITVFVNHGDSLFVQLNVPIITSKFKLVYCNSLFAINITASYSCLSGGNTSALLYKTGIETLKVVLILQYYQSK